MKKLLLAFSFLIPVFASAQVFYTETFDGSPCPGNSGCDPTLVSWTTTNVGTNGANANKFYVSCAENGNAAGQCGSGCGNDQSLHVGNVATSTAAIFFCPGGDCGAAFDDSGAGEATDKRCESPVINCTGQSNITIDFVYIEQGGAGSDIDDDASLWYFDGATWAMLTNMANTVNTGCGGQGKWTAFTFNLPASANNNPGVKIGFRWTNDGDGNAADPSFAVDDITLTTNTTTPPTASFTASNQTICEGDCIDFTNTSTGGPFTVTSWTFTGSSTPTSTTNNPTNICYPTAGTYDVSLTVTDANGTDTDTQVGYITVTSCASPPTASFTASNQSICVGDCIDFTNTSTGGPFTVTSWTFTGAATASSTANNPANICYNTPGTYDVSLTVTDANGTDTDTQVGFITVTTCASPPVANFTASSQSICVGDAITFTDLSTNSPNAWNWTFTGGTPASSVLQNPTIVYNTPGTYAVTLIATNTAGSDTLTQTAYITVINCPVPTAAFTLSSSTICAGDCITVTNTSQNGTSYVWTFTGGTPSSSTQQDPGTVCYAMAGVYTIELIATNSQGSDTISSTVTVTNTPTVFASADTTINLGESVTIVAVGSGSGTYIWTPSTGLGCATCASTSATPQVTTSYIVSYSEGGCAVTDTVVIDVIVIEGIGLPNAFSPNGDNFNDVLSVLGQGIASMDLRIYNRYGQLVFKSTDQAQGWDGTHNNKKVNPGVFAYVLEYTLVSGETQKITGNVTLVR